MKPWQPARARPQKEVVSPLELPGGQAWPGLHVIAECGLCRDFLPCLPLFLLWALLRTSRVTMAPPARNISFRRPRSTSPGRPGQRYCHRAPPGGLLAFQRPTWASPSPPWGTQEKGFFSPTGGRSHILSVASRTERWPQAERWQVCDAVGPSQASSPQTICKYLSRVCSLALWAQVCGHTEMPCAGQGACVLTGRQPDAWNQGPVDLPAMLLILGCLGRCRRNIKTWPSARWPGSLLES